MEEAVLDAELKQAEKESKRLEKQAGKKQRSKNRYRKLI
jgi:hypothetical protein